MEEMPHSFIGQKKEIELSILRTILTQLDNGTISYEQSREIARFVLVHVEHVKDAEGLLSFLKELAAEWHIFENVRDLFRLKVRAKLHTEEKLKETKAKLAQMQAN